MSFWLARRMTGLNDMKHYVSRTCTWIDEKKHIRDTRSLAEFRAMPAYVLLGDPGAGKTVAFEQEANVSREYHYVTARNLIAFEDRSEWHGKTLFIDGLDEVRAGSADVRSPFDIIRARLEKLGRPPFRLSCREADWFGDSDRESLKEIAPEGREVEVLHLDPLTKGQVKEVLTYDERVNDPDAFINEAERRGLMNLIFNPQILDMVIATVGEEGNWPESRLETFVLACRTLIREHNREHLVADRNDAVDVEAQLDAAGLLCAVQLITGKAGYTLSSAEREAPYASINEVAYNNADLLHRVVKTKLFTISNEQAAPIHRSVAEYLGAYYLTKLIEQEGLPVGRVLALVTGEDGKVVSDLRGLYAWLATLCIKERPTLIEHDPLGIILYGDAQGFSPADKRRILRGLSAEAKFYEGFRSGNWIDRPFGALCTQDMESTFHRVLISTDRTEAHQALVDCALDAMLYGEPLHGLRDVVLEIVRDRNYFPPIRKQALRVFIHLAGDKQEEIEQLQRLLDEIDKNSISDPDDELLGQLLEELYPAYVTPTAVFDYLHMPKNPHLLGEYAYFWSHELPERSTDVAITELLDELVRRKGSLESVLDEFHFQSMTRRLLARGLEVYENDPEPKRLYDWLGLGLDRHGSPSWLHENEEGGHIVTWLENHPEIQKAIIKLGLEECSDKDRLDMCMFMVTRRLLNARPPSDYGIWCLENAKNSSDEREAKYFLHEAVGALLRPDISGGLSLESLEEAAEEQSRLKPWLQGLLYWRLDSRQQELTLKQRERQREREQQKREWIQVLKSHQSAIQDGSAPLKLLDVLATAYLGYYIDARGDSPDERLDDFLNGDEGLKQAALAGFRNCLDRKAVPDVSYIIHLNTEDRRHFLARPFRVGLERISHEAPQKICELEEEQIRKALAFHFTEAIGEEPEWYKQLVRARPDLVAAVLIEYGTAMIHAGKEHVAGVYSLAYDNSHARVSCEAAPALLDAFPVRCTAKQLKSLDSLLKAALKHADRNKLLRLVKEKLEKTSMNVAQRVRWIATGLIADPAAYEQLLDAYVDGKTSRIQHLSVFLSERFEQRPLCGNLPESTLALLIRQLGSQYPPYELEGGGGWVSPAMEAADFVNNALISRLENIPSVQATQELEKLQDRDGLVQWRKRLRRALYHQSARRRESNFLHPDIQKVNRSLQNRHPANTADLAALAVDHIRQLGKRIRDANTNDYKQYWNLDEYGRPTTRRREEECRNAFLSDLRERLAPLQVEVQPESQFADNKKADIRVSKIVGQEFNVPIEVKCNDHRELWHAIHTQLKPKYIRDPGTSGYGIYLVFWFGTKGMPPAPEGRAPKTALELEDRLKETLKTFEERRQITVCVIDCSVPVVFEAHTDLQ